MPSNIFCACRKYGMQAREAIREAVFDANGASVSADFHTLQRCFNLPHEHVHDAVQAAYRELAKHPKATNLPSPTSM